MSYKDYKNKILKSADADFEFLGLEGFYFYVFLGGVGLGFLLLAIISSFTNNFLAIIGIPVSIIALVFFICKRLSQQYGRGGYTAIIDQSIPRSIQIRADKECYKKLK